MQNRTACTKSSTRSQSKPLRSRSGSRNKAMARGTNQKENRRFSAHWLNSETSKTSLYVASACAISQMEKAREASCQKYLAMPSERLAVRKQQKTSRIPRLNWRRSDRNGPGGEVPNDASTTAWISNIPNAVTMIFCELDNRNTPPRHYLLRAFMPSGYSGNSSIVPIAARRGLGREPFRYTLRRFVV